MGSVVNTADSVTKEVGKELTDSISKEGVTAVVDGELIDSIAKEEGSELADSDIKVVDGEPTDFLAKEVDRELLPFLRVFKDGSVERLRGSPIVPPSHGDAKTNCSSTDITISEDPRISARIHRPNLIEPNQKVPILVYFHGGGFCFESAYSLTETTLMKRLVSIAKVVAISVEYRLAPEHNLPIAFEDSWAGLKWVASHSTHNVVNKESWISDHGDFSRVYIGGDSAGANIAHNIVMRAGTESSPGDIKLLGCFLTHPYFWGSKPIGSESKIDRETHIPYRVCTFLYPSALGGIDNPMINPLTPGAPSLAGLGCSKLFISIAEKDELRERGVMYYNAIKESGWKGEVELIEVKDEDHAFHLLNYDTDNAKNLIKRLASFLV